MREADIDPDRELGALVRDVPASGRALEDLGIDHCCGGDQTLAAACQANDLDVSTVRKRLRDAADRDAEVPDWESMTDLVDVIVTTHHAYLREELPQLADLVWTVRNAHEDAHPELREVELEFTALAEAMQSHTEEEEREVFPLIERLDRGEELTEAEAERLRVAFLDLEDDHEETAEHLERIADLTDGYAVPADACPSYRSMLDRLEALERDTHRHVHRENNVLFVDAARRLAEQTGRDVSV